ncbi:MAG: hypothetical protein AAFR74_00655 [Pseudomonadota bacterium]
MPKVKVLRVLDIKLDILKSDPPQLAVSATGVTTTTGWTQPELVPLEEELSADGILDLEFVAEAPTGIVPQVITPTAASFVWTDDVDRIVAVRVVARTNDPIEFLAGPKELSMSGFKLPDLPITTLAIGEEGGPFTTEAVGEEGPPTKTVLGEEGSPPIFKKALIGEESPTKTLALGEEKPIMGEKGPLGETGPGLETPGKTAVGEVPPDIFERLGQRNPFGSR